MTQEDKQLLLYDLCARLPYGVKILQGGVIIETLQSICKVGNDLYTVNALTNDMYNGFSIEEVKPYLRPLSSMTEKESAIKYKLFGNYILDNCTAYIDWLNTHHFDHRGLIEKGLALESPKDMYKTE